MIAAACKLVQQDDTPHEQRRETQEGPSEDGERSIMISQGRWAAHGGGTSIIIKERNSNKNKGGHDLRIQRTPRGVVFLVVIPRSGREKKRAVFNEESSKPYKELKNIAEVANFSDQRQSAVVVRKVSRCYSAGLFCTCTARALKRPGARAAGSRKIEHALYRTRAASKVPYSGMGVYQSPFDRATVPEWPIASSKVDRKIHTHGPIGPAPWSRVSFII